MKYVTRLAVLGAMIAGTLAAFGCGSDDTPVDPRGPLNLGIRNGTWATHDSTVFVGPDSCADRLTEVFSADTVLCNLDPVGEVGPFEIRCDVTEDGSNVTYDCSIVANLDPCTLTLEITGSGTVTDTTYDLVSTVFQTVSGPDIPCDILYTADPCTAQIFSTGTWISAEGDSLCPSEAGAVLPWESLIRRTAEVPRHGSQ